MAKRRPDTGLVRPYRPRPAEFREVYIRIGWDGITDYFRTNWRVIRRWIIEEGQAELIEARAAYVAEKAEQSRSRRKRYVLGRTMTAVQSRKRGE